MALPDLNKVELQYLNNWFSNLVDTLNYNLGKIEDEVVTLDKVLVTIDTAPIDYLRDSLNDIVLSINKGFEQIEERLSKLEARSK